MNLRKKILARFVSFGERERLALLIPAFTHAADEERVDLGLQLAGIDRAEAISTLLREWHRLQPEKRASIARRCSNATLEAVADISRTPDRQLLRNAIELIHDCAAPPLLPILASIGKQASRSTDDRARAMDVLLRLTVHHIGRCGTRTITADAFREIDRALTIAVTSYRDHRCDDVLLAAAIASENERFLKSALQHALARPDEPATMAMRRVPGQIGDELVRCNLIRWLGNELLQRAVLRHLDGIRTADQWDDILRSGHLLNSPARRRILRRHPKPRTLVPPIRQAIRLSAAGQSNLIDWVRAVGMTGKQRVGYARDLIALPDPLARLKAVRLLGDLAASGDDAANQALETFCRDRDPHVARLASRTMRGLAPKDNRRHPTSAELVRQWSERTECARHELASRLAAHDRSAAASALRTCLTGSNRHIALEAIDLCERLRLIDLLHADLVNSLDGPDAHVASAAARLLSRDASAGTDEQPSETLCRCLRHENDRVRANAVESLGCCRKASAIQELRPLTGIGNNRIRANAIRAIIQLEPATSLEDWRMMLSDPRPLHRISAIWIARRTPCREMLNDLHQLSQTDEHDAVRLRAAATARWLERFPPTTTPTE